MARHENDEIDIDLPEPDSYLHFYYSHRGKETSKDDPKAYCKKVVNTQNNRTTYYAKYGRGVLFDPWGIFAGKERSRDFSLVKVSEQVFEHYYKFIEGKNRSFLSLAERSMVDV